METYVLIFFFAWYSVVLALIDSGALFHRRAASLMKVEHNTFVKPGSDSCKVFEDLVFIFELSF